LELDSKQAVYAELLNEMLSQFPDFWCEIRAYIFGFGGEFNYHSGKGTR
jgi:hypothetical protein